MSYDDFCKCTIAELEEIFDTWNKSREDQIHFSWELMRLHAVMTMQPHCKKRLIPEKILPFPWEKKITRKRTGTVDKEIQRKRFEELARRCH